MPPSPALRFSPGREPRAENHKRGRSLESGLLFREKDDDLALFNEMQSRERENFLLQSSDDLEDSFATKLRNFSDIKLGITIPGRGESSNLLTADGDKNDYDWLLTPPDTPLFPSLEDEPLPMNVASRGRPRSKPISISRSSTMEKSYRSSRGSASPNRLSPSPRTGNNTLQSRGRPSSAPNSSPNQSLRHATPLRRPSPSPPNKPLTPAPRSSTPTPRRMSTGSSGPAVSSGIRGTSPVKSSRGNSASPKIRAWQTNIPGFSSEAPPNLRTSLADRPASYVRGSSPASRNSRDSTSKFSRTSMSPTASRSSSSFHSHDRDQFSSRSKGSVASSGDDDLDSLQSIPVGNIDRPGSRRGGSISNNRALAFSKKSARTVSPNVASKRSLDSTLRPMDPKSPQNMFRPLLSSVPSTTLYAGKANSAHRSLASRNSSVTTSSNGNSDPGASIAPDTGGSYHNQDDMAIESEKILYPDMHEEVFAFDKIDDENIGREINDESIDIQYGGVRGPKIDCCPIESEDSGHHCINSEVNESSETFKVRADIIETGSYKNLTICSHCGCRYEPTVQAEKDFRLCPECSRKNKLERVIIPETTLAFAEDSSVHSGEEKLSAETVQLMVASDLPQESDVGDLRFSLGEQDAEESQTSCSEQIQDHSQESALPTSLLKGDGQKPASHLEMDQSKIDYKKPNNDVVDRQLYNYNDRPNLKVDLLEGTGISVLLKRSSSSKGPVVQGRTFTASTISYDDSSLARDSANSVRSSSGHGSYSASSSIDLGSARHTEFRVPRQLSGKKLDAECGYDIRIKPQSTESSFSGISNHSHHGLGLTTEESSSGNTECGIIEEIPIVSRDGQTAQDTVNDAADTSSVGLTVVEEDKYEDHDSGRLTDNFSSELTQQAGGVQSDYNSMPSFTNHGDCISIENVENHPNNKRIVSNTETSAIAPGSSCDEEHNGQSSSADGLDASLTTTNSTITESEIEREKCCPDNPGLGDDDLPLVSISGMDDFQESSFPNPSNDHLAASVPESNTSEYSHGIEESTVRVECHGAGNTRSLTLEEATDAILFCNSIIHDLAYQAATIAMEKDSSASDPFEGSEPTVTILGKPNSNRKDLRSRTVGKRALKSQKVARQRKVETETKSKAENDENVDKSFTQNVGLPSKVDNMKPPKLESKCNCTIM